jgi:hypothetical protein
MIRDIQQNSGSHSSTTQAKEKLAFHDHEKLARDVRRHIDVTKVTDNPALQLLFTQLQNSDMQFSFQRVFAQSMMMRIM